MDSSKRLVFFGNEKLATGVTTDRPVSRALLDSGYEIVARIEDDIPTDLARMAAGAPAAILAAYGHIIPQKVLELFPEGIINIHPSLLPLYRGPTPIEAAILEGAKETGISLMKLVPELDAGPIFAQAKIKLAGNETKQQLADKLSDLGTKLLISELPKILDGSKKPMSQNDELATYTKRIKKTDGWIDFKKPAEQIEREVRAYAGWPRSRAKIFGKEIIITKVRVAANESNGDLVIQCQPGWLEIQELIAPSGLTMSGVDFLRGYRR